jgi:hypothetical protein
MTVYFIQSEGPDGLIKIGYTKNVFKRLQDLRNNSSYPLKLLHDVDGDVATERAMHERFIHLHYRGEWFRPGEDLLAFCGIKPKREKKVKKTRRKRWQYRPRVPASIPPSPWDEIVEDIERHIYANPVVPDPSTPKYLVEQHRRYMAELHAQFGSPVAVPAPPASDGP